MVTFCILVFPLPYTVRKKLFQFLSESFIVAKIAYGLKISFMYVSLSHSIIHQRYIGLQICRDSLPGCSSADVPRRGRSRHAQDWPRIERCSNRLKYRSSQILVCRVPAHVFEAFTDLSRGSSAQRNMYLTGFCLFLSLVLTRTFYIILDLIHTQGEYAKLKKAVSGYCLSAYSIHIPRFSADGQLLEEHRRLRGQRKAN